VIHTARHAISTRRFECHVSRAQLQIPLWSTVLESVAEDAYEEVTRFFHVRDIKLDVIQSGKIQVLCLRRQPRAARKPAPNNPSTSRRPIRVPSCSMVDSSRWRYLTTVNISRSPSGEFDQSSQELSRTLRGAILK
jgi:hypothetical protein